MTIEEAIRTGIEYEIAVEHVYAEAAKHFADPVARRIFMVLAGEERRHVEYLESRLEEWTETGKVTAERLGTAIPSTETIEAGLRKLSRRMAQQDYGDELAMLRKALELEQHATEFFEKMVRELRADEQKLFARFVEIEKGHEAIVQAEIDALTGLGFWFDFQEFKLEGA